MKKVERIILLTDERTSGVGRCFFETLAVILRDQGKEVTVLDVRTDQNTAEAVSRFDEITRISPDLLLVADFACIRMQGTEEEPMYNNSGIPTVHILFRRPWEYEVFMIWRCDFTTRFYCLLEEDVSYIRTFYPRLLNVSSLRADIWDTEAKAVCYAEEGTLEALETRYGQMPAYMKTMAEIYENIKEKKPSLGDAQAMQECLTQISFACTASEYMDILYMMRHVFARYYLKQAGASQYRMPLIHTDAAGQQAEEFLSLDFAVTLLGSQA